MNVAIRLDEVTKRFGRTAALDGVSLCHGRGALGLLGPNGAGKTTLLRILATVAAPTRGAVSLLGLDPAEPGPRIEIRRRLGYVPQEAGFPSGFTGFEYVDYVAILKQLADRRTRHDEVRRVLGVMGLTDVVAKKIRRLSSGMRRRLVIAQALLGDPRLVVLDEPTAGLDLGQRLRLRDLVTTLAERRCVVISTHQTEDVAALCPRLVVLHEGRVRFDGTPAQLAGLAESRVWTGPARGGGARLAWGSGDGTLRQVGEPPPGAALTEPTLADGYLLLVGAPETAPKEGVST
jgi:ABC-2 type transport system ATP-binding protein